MQINRRHFNRLLVGAAAVPALSAMGGIAAAQEVNRWGTSVLGGGSQVALAAIIAAVDQANPDLRVQEQITGGPVENVRLLSQGLLEIAQTTTNVAFNAYEGRVEFEGAAVPMLGLFTLYPANCTFAVLADSEIQSIEDLKGKRIAIGPPAAGITIILEAWLDAYGIAESASLIRIGYTEGADQLRSGGVDAALVYGAGAAAVGYLQELDVSADIRILGWDVEGEQYAKLKESAPEMAVFGTFAKGLVSNLEQDLVVPTTYASEYVGPNFPEEAGYELVKALWDSRDDIAQRAALGAWLSLDPKNMLIGLLPNIPVHPGAARFFQEQGVWNDSYTVGEVG